MMPRRSLWLLALIPAALLSSCGKGPQGGAGAAVRTEAVEGVTPVHNPPVPLNPKKNVRFEEEVSFGAEASGPGMIFQPGHFTVDARNRVFIFESGDGVIKLFGDDGLFLKSIGRKGQGPGEVGYVTFLGFCPDGRLLVTDFRNKRTSFFGPEGDDVTSFRLANRISLPPSTRRRGC